MAPVSIASNSDDEVDHNKDDDNHNDIRIDSLKDGKYDDRVVHTQTIEDGAVVSEKMPSSIVTNISLSTTTSTASATGIETASNQKNESENNQIGGLSITVRIISSWICISRARLAFETEEELTFRSNRTHTAIENSD